MSDNLKYEFTGETLTTDDGRTLRRIRRLADGAIGGWIESERNLSHDGSCWVFDSAQVSGSAWVSGEAQVFGSARVFGEAEVFDSAEVFGSAWVFGKSKVSRTPITANLGKHPILVDDQWLVSIGCQQWPLDNWLLNAERIGKENDYSDSAIAIHLDFLSLLNRARGG